ncbi:MAG TPA: deiodinase-like protein [Stellaceae bacterium]|nr:deiodinase-like protein [Stellaceae bacterium]
MRLNEIHGRYRDRVRFFVVYIREAHPDDGWRVPENLRQEIHVREPKSASERRAVAMLCQINLDLEMPMLVDQIDNRVEESYLSRPLRLYLIGRDGRIAYTGDQGPFGFNPDSWEAAIKAEIGA